MADKMADKPVKKQTPIRFEEGNHEKLKEISMEKFGRINLNLTMNILIRDYRVVKIGKFNPMKNRKKINNDD